MEIKQQQKKHVVIDAREPLQLANGELVVKIELHAQQKK
jgi:hypothetical protein